MGRIGIINTAGTIPVLCLRTRSGRRPLATAGAVIPGNADAAAGPASGFLRFPAHAGRAVTRRSGDTGGTVPVQTLTATAVTGRRNVTAGADRFGITYTTAAVPKSSRRTRKMTGTSSLVERIAGRTTRRGSDTG